MEKDLKAKPMTKKIYKQLKDDILQLTQAPCLTLLSVGKDPASEFYIGSIKKRAAKLAIEVKHLSLEQSTTEESLLEHIEFANRDNNAHAIMVQKPLPDHINDDKVSSSISADKDVDGFSPENLGKLMLDQECFQPCTPEAVMKLLEFYEIDLTGKNTVLCGRSMIVGKPLLNMLIRKKNPGNATVTVCHSRTKNIEEFTRKGDILITAIGIAEFIKSDQVKPGAIVIDVGTNEVQKDGKTIYVGDVDYQGCYEKVAAITPVPGGIGSVTTAVLMNNIVKAAHLNQNK